MFIPFSIFINYDSPFPWYFGPALQIVGLLCMFLTRFTFRFYSKIGKASYVISALLRPLGIFLIAWAWVEILSNPPLLKNSVVTITIPFLILSILVILILAYDSILKKFAIIILSVFTVGFIVTITVLSQTPVSFIAGIVISFLWSLWSIIHLGLRRSFLYSKIDDQLIKDGPYAYQRHPQLLAAIVMAGCSILSFNPVIGSGDSLLVFGFGNLAIITVGIMLLIRFEEKDLILRFGNEYIEYQNKVPALIGSRLKSKNPSFKFVSAISIPIYLAVAALGLYMYSKGDELDLTKLPVLWGYNANHDRMSRVTWWDMRHLAGYIIKAKTNDSFPDELPRTVLQKWKDENRAVKYSIYPQTLFYCDKVYYSFDPVKPPEIRGRKLPVVTKLPFPLKCTDEKKEFAQAMDYDGDGFPQVYLYYVSKTRDYRVDPIIAADDGTDEVKKELAQRVYTTKQ